MGRVRAAAVVIHRWLGLLVGLVLVVVGLSGSIIAYSPELSGLIHPQIKGPPPSGWESRRAAVLSLIERDHAPAGLVLVRFPSADQGVYELYLEGDRNRYIDALSGEAVLERSIGTDIVMFSRELHTHLLTGENGELALGWLGVAALVLLLSGLWLGWPRSGWQRALRLPGSLGWRPQFLYWHKTAGLLVLPLLFLVTLTGVGMVFYAPAQWVLSTLLGGAPATLARTDQSRAASTDWTGVLATVDRQLSGGRTVFYYPPQAADQSLLFRKQMPGELHPNGRSMLSVARNGSVVGLVDDTQSAAGIRATHSIYPLHSGRTGSETWRLLVALSGLLPLGFFITGLFLYQTRRNRYANPARPPHRAGGACVVPE